MLRSSHISEFLVMTKGKIVVVTKINPTRGQSFYLLGLEVGINVVTLWTGWNFSEDEWEIIS